MVAKYVILRVEYFTSLRHSSANWDRRSDNTDVIPPHLLKRQQLTGNPYKSPASSNPANSASSIAPFPRFSAGPLLGAVIGLSHVVAVVGVWAYHGYPDFFFRSPESVWFSVIAMAAGGAIFGLLYAAVLKLAMESLSRTLKTRLHFYAGILSAFIVTIISCELSIQRSLLQNPLLVIAAIVACTFIAAIVTGQRTNAESRE